MKYLFCAALLLAGCANAGELLPVQGDEAEAVQERLDEYALPAVQALADHVKVESIIESIRLAGKAKRMFLGPFAGDSHIALRIRIIDGDQITETLIEDEGGNWRGTVQWGQDGNMLEETAIKAAEFIENYRQNLSSGVGLGHDQEPTPSTTFTLEAIQHNPGDDSPAGLAAPASLPAAD